MINLRSKSGLSEHNCKGRDFNRIQYTFTRPEFSLFASRHISAFQCIQDIRNIILHSQNTSKIAADYLCVLTKQC